MVAAGIAAFEGGSHEKCLEECYRSSEADVRWLIHGADSMIDRSNLIAKVKSTTVRANPIDPDSLRPVSPPTPNAMQQPPIILLKEGTDTSQGKPQLISNINACQAIADSIRTTLGPRGMDKLVVDGRGMGLSFRRIVAHGGVPQQTLEYSDNVLPIL